MKFYLIAAAAVGILLAGVAVAQVSPTRRTNNPAPQAGQPNGTIARLAADAGHATSIAGIPAVATSSAEDVQPASGADRFTAAEFRSWLESDGFSDISNLIKSPNGVWRPMTMKDDGWDDVWLDDNGSAGTGT